MRARPRTGGSIGLGGLMVCLLASSAQGQVPESARALDAPGEIPAENAESSEGPTAEAVGATEAPNTESVASPNSESVASPNTEANEVPPSGLSDRIAGRWTLFGATVGTLIEDGDGTTMAGIEVSYAHYLPSAFWYGMLFEGRWDERAKAAFAVGLEGGYGVLGADLSLFLRFPDAAAVGVRGRVCLSVVGAVTFCGGGAVLSGRHRFAEIAIVLKYPRRLGD